MRNLVLVLGLLGHTKSEVIYNEASEPIECACATPSQIEISFSWYSAVETKSFPYDFTGDYERLESEFCSQIREEFSSCGSYKQKEVNYESFITEMTSITINGFRQRNWSDFDCKATCGSASNIIGKLNSGWLALIAFLVVIVLLVCMCRGCLKLYSKCCSATPEESNYGPGRSTLFVNDSP